MPWFVEDHGLICVLVCEFQEMYEAAFAALRARIFVETLSCLLPVSVQNWFHEQHLWKKVCQIDDWPPLWWRWTESIVRKINKQSLLKNYSESEFSERSLSRWWVESSSIKIFAFRSRLLHRRFPRGFRLSTLWSNELLAILPWLAHKLLPAQKIEGPQIKECMASCQLRFEIREETCETGAPTESILRALENVTNLETGLSKPQWNTNVLYQQDWPSNEWKGGATRPNL